MYVDGMLCYEGFPKELSPQDLHRRRPRLRLLLERDLWQRVAHLRPGGVHRVGHDGAASGQQGEGEANCKWKVVIDLI